ncbi:integrase family protein [Aromatoleum bremense]|uniref:Tyrosine-type recombinase/integrase n=1 Tax=Aromatoleum bremense TaxID=76115 RepID=A0ABX1NV45_9RHOO|nr:integrase family protein [Aromatoleum bremense]NMG15511.1 tyrosine-type recombinase/integrase [Aromatoleum bremense]QTQ31550.1 Integrase, phage-related [Aromatoleum bremense]
MQRERLTPDRIRRFACPDGTKQAFLWDTVAPRLAVRATAGAKSYIFEAKMNRQTIRRTIGDVRAWNLDDARAEANRLQVLVESGTDPRELDRKEAEAKAAAKAAQEAAKRTADERSRYTLRALCDAYTGHLERTGKDKSAAATRSAFKCHVFTHEAIAAAPAREVTSHQIAAMVRKVREAGKERAAGILRSYLSAAYNAAKRAPFDSAMPADLIAFGVEHNPVDNIPAIAVQAGNRTLSADELRAYLNALGDELPDQALRLALLAGGQRMAQLLRAKVSDFDTDTATLRLWDGKGKRQSAREHLLPLAPKAAALAAGLVARAKKREQKRAEAAGEVPGDVGGRWLFSTHGKVAMTFTTPGKRVAEISAAMKGEPFDLRDIRRTCETMLAGMGISRDTRAQLLSHGISGVQATHYDRHSYTDEKRTALVAWEARLDAIEKGEKPAGNVVTLRSA